MSGKWIFFGLLAAALGMAATDRLDAATSAAPGAPTGTSVPGDHHNAATQPATRPDAPFPKDINFRPAEIGRVIFVINEPSLLRHVLPQLVLRRVTLSKVLTEFSVLTNTNVAAGWAAMAQAGIKPSQRATLRLPKQSYQLDLVAALKAFAPQVHMVISADENVIFVNTQAADNQHLIMRTYWLEDLIANIPRYINPDSFQRQKAKVNSKNGGGKKSRPESSGTHGSTVPPATAGHSVRSRPGPPADPQTNILQLITDHVEPKVWVNHGGKATISQVGNKVIVIAPASVQALLRGPAHYNPNAAPLFMSVSY